MTNVEFNCEVCRRGFVRRWFDPEKPPRFCSHACKGLASRAPGDWLERRREINLRAKRKARAKQKRLLGEIEANLKRLEDTVDRLSNRT